MIWFLYSPHLFEKNYNHNINVFCIPRISDFISRVTKSWGVSQAKAKNIPREIKLSVAAPSDRTLNVVFKTPEVQFSCPLFTHRKYLDNTLSHRLHIHSSFWYFNITEDNVYTWPESPYLFANRRHCQRAGTVQGQLGRQDLLHAHQGSFRWKHFKEQVLLNRQADQ